MWFWSCMLNQHLCFGTFRSRAQLEKMTEQLVLDATQPGVDEEDPDLNRLSGGDVRTSRNELLKNVSPSNRRLRIQNEGNEILIQGIDYRRTAL